MRFRFPGTDLHVRFFERVATKDSQYDIFDLGIEYSEDAIDSIAVGGSFSTVKSWAGNQDQKAAKKAAKKARKKARKAAEAAAAASEARAEANLQALNDDIEANTAVA